MKKSKKLPKINISLDKAKTNKLFYVVPTGIIYRDSDKRWLILQRSFDEIAYRGLYERVNSMYGYIIFDIV